MNRRSGSAALGLVLRALVVILWTCAGLACRAPQPQLREGPPSIDARTPVLARFDPAKLAEPGPATFDLDRAASGPPPPPEPPKPPPLPAPAVVDYGPTGEASEYPTIQIRFNRAMVPLGEKRRVSAAEAGFTITPKVEGEAYWAEPTRLVFEPREALPLAHEYTVAFDREVESVDGPPLKVDLEWRFGTQPPQISMNLDYDDRMDDGSGGLQPRAHWKAAVDLVASQTIRASELRDHLKVHAVHTDGTSTPVDVTLRGSKQRGWGGERHYQILPVGRWPADAQVVLELDASIRGEVGPRPSSHPVRFSFFTVQGVTASAYTCTEGDYADGCELGPVVVQFSAPIDRAQAKYVSISPEPKHFGVLPVDRDWPGAADKPRPNAYRGVMLWGEFARGVDYAIHVDERLRDVHGQPLVNTEAFEVTFVEPPPSLRLERSRGSFSLSHGTKLGVETRHVEALRVRTLRVDAAQVAELLHRDLDSGWPAGFGKARSDRIALAHTGNFGWSAHELDMTQFTGGKPGALLVEIGVDALLPRAQGRTKPRPRVGLVQITKLGVTAVSSLPGGFVRVANLDDDKPVRGASVEVVNDGGFVHSTQETDADGLVNLGRATSLPRGTMLRIRAGDDVLVVDAANLQRNGDPDSGDGLSDGERVLATIMTERPLYRPGERVRVMGWAAVASPYALASLRTLPAKTRVDVELRDRDGELVDAARDVLVKAHGKLWATLDIPEHGSLGEYEARVVFASDSFSTRLRVEDYAIPEFEVSAATDRSDVHGGESTTVRVDASYYFGGRVPITSGRHQTTCTRASFRPPGLDPSASVAPTLDHYAYGRGIRPHVRLGLGPAAAKGHVEYAITPQSRPAHYTHRCKHSVAVGDATKREVGAEANVWLHPDFYLSAKSPRALEHGEDMHVELATVDFDGSPRPVRQIEVRLTREWLEPEFVRDGKERVFAGWQRKTKALAPCTVATTEASAGTATCDFTKLDHGSYDVEISAFDEAGKKTDESYVPTIHRWLWVSEPHTQTRWPVAPVSTLQLSVDRPEAKAGETVRARIQAPWKQGAGLLILAKGGVQELRTFDFDQGLAELEFVADDAWIPGVGLRVLAIEPGTKTSLPRLRADDVRIEVAADARALSVTVEAPRQAQTQETIPIEIDVRDAAGKPTAGHVSVWAVDEAVLSLAPLELPAFVEAFAKGFPSGLWTEDSYRELMLPYAARPDPYAPRRFDPRWRSGGAGYGSIGMGSASGFGSGGGSAGGIGFGSRGGSPMPAARSEFSSAPIFIGDATVGADGVAHVEGKLPDNLTTFRLTAVASAPLANGEVEARFGTGDARVRVTRPLIVRAALPRILRPGDQAEIGVLVDNLGAGDGEVAVEFTLHDEGGAIELLSKPKATAKLAAGEQIRVPFTIRAKTTGTPKVEARATLTPASGAPGLRVGDAVLLPLPVEPERTQTDRVAVYGTLADDGAALLPFEIPSDADPKFGGLSVSVGSTLLGGLEDAVTYLVRYPHGCLEQTSSSLLPMIPLGSLLDQGYPLGIPDVDAHVAAGIRRLASMQLPSGGFAYWPGGTTEAPYASAYAIWVLHRAHEAGYAVPSRMLDDADRYLRGVVEQWSARIGPSLGEDIEVALMLAALSERGPAPVEAIDALYARRQRLPVFAQATLLMAVEASTRHQGPDPRIPELLGELRSLVDEREAVAKVETDGPRLTWYWDTDARSSAVVLMAMLRTDPDHALVPKLTRGLLETRRGGRWSNTQENAWALLALADYAAIYEVEEPDFAGRVWLGNETLAEVRVQGRAFGFEDGFTAMDALLGVNEQAATSASAATSTATSTLGADRLILERAGTGRMYYRVGLEWASTRTDRPAKAEGIRIARTLRGAEGIVGVDQAVDSGALLAIDVEIEVPAALDHVAIEVPLPAGLEAINLELGKGTDAMKLSGGRGSWVSHEELRRDRAVVFADHIAPGKYRTTVFLRATTPGEYVMPAASAEMMYYPEIYGRTTSRRLLVR